ncbi:hypothetical protein AAFF_G00264330 [Aldrovandia affinis]|uniref:Aminomethyltransferase folate-binding domain-containing protein n=1 Tax=Aldrovandia affinis TaxID=143900 RepID=A0AAD7ST98_9TELE|nr:hypothetical protein AAFF_G00264330 [Aldrovandia affinis]
MYNHCVAPGLLRRLLRLSLKAGGRTCREAHSDTGQKTFVCYNLSHRTLIKVHGQDTGSFLQGLITNDIYPLTEGRQTASYAHMLNVQGRTLYDIIIYSLKGGETSVLLECDSTVQDSVQRHLKVYKIRRKVTISPCADLSVWATDPRAEVMGWRLVADKRVDPLELIGDSQPGAPEQYHRHRYEIGLPEGVKDLPPGVALPLESNLVYMQGISFSKGCYIGQELTARTHHTGVVRKRLMPVRLSGPARGSDEGAELLTEKGRSAGKHRAGLGETGLSLVRLAYAHETLILKNSALTVQASLPGWWPKDHKAK